MEFVPIQDTKDHFEAFAALEREFTQYYINLGIGEQYGRILPENLAIETLKSEFNEYRQQDGMFFFVKDGGKYIAYGAGKIEAMPQGYEVKKVGTISSMAVSAKFRGQGIGTMMKDRFFDWFRSRGITMCHIYVKPENAAALKLYEKWGFKADEYRMWKDLKSD